MSYENIEYEHTGAFFEKLKGLIEEGESKLLISPRIVSESNLKDERKKWYVLVKGNNLKFILPELSDPEGFHKDFIYSKAKKYFGRASIQKPTEMKVPEMDFLEDETLTVIDITA